VAKRNFISALLATAALFFTVGDFGLAQDEKSVVVVGSAAAVGGGQKWAFLVGVDNYEDKEGIGALNFCAADARLLYQVLTDPRVGGFPPENVVLLTDREPDPALRPTLSNIASRAVAWLALAGPEDTVVFFFSGHGAEEEGQSYLLPVDAKASAISWTSISVDAVKQKLRGCKASKRVLITDACHSGSGKGAEGAMGAGMNRDLFEQSEGLVTLASCGLEEKSYEYPEMGQGAFTHFLVEALRGAADANSDGVTTATEANVYTWDRTRRWAAGRGLQQNPKYVAAVQGDIPLTGRLRQVIGTIEGDTIVNRRAGKPSLAVVRFEALSAPAECGLQLAEALTNALVNTRRFEVVERSRVERLLAGQEGAGSVAPEVLAMIASDAGVQLVVAGSVSQEGGSLAVNARLLEATSGRVSKSERVTGSMEGLERLARELASRIATAYPIVSSVISVEGGAVVVDAGSEDGVDAGMVFEFYREQNVQTLVGMRVFTEPAGRGRAERVEAQVCRATVLENRGVKAGDRARSVAGEFGAVALEATGTLEVQTAPAGAVLYLDGKEMGPTPWLGRLAAREYQVTLRKQGYEDDFGVAKVEADSKALYAADLTPQRGRLVITSQPSGASVLLDGEGKGRTPVTIPGVAAGDHTVVLEAVGGKRWEQTVRVEPGGEVKMEALLQGDVGGIRVVTRPAGAQVFVDGVQRGTTPYSSTHVPPGRHEVKVVLPGYSEKSEWVVVQSGQQAALEWSLAPARLTLNLNVDRRDRRYRIAQPISVSFRASEDCYVYIYDVAPGGTLFRLFPNAYVPSAQVTGRKDYAIPGEGYRDRVGLRVDGPAGQETFVAIASRQPLDLGIVLEECGSYGAALERLREAMTAVGPEATVERLAIEVVQ